MSNHPIEGLMVTAMNSIKDMIDVNTIIGDPIQTLNNIVIIPISKVSFGFAAGGSEFSGETVDEYSKRNKEEQIQYRLPFGGGSGAGVTINPVAFIVVNKDNVKLIPANHSSVIDKLIDYVPDLIEKTSQIMNKCIKDKEKNEKTEKYSKEKTSKIEKLDLEFDKDEEDKNKEKEKKHDASAKTKKQIKYEEEQIKYEDE